MCAGIPATALNPWVRVGPIDGAFAGMPAKALDHWVRHLYWIFGSSVEHVADPGMAWCLREQGGEGEEGRGDSLLFVWFLWVCLAREPEGRWEKMLVHCSVRGLKRGGDSEPLWVVVP